MTLQLWEWCWISVRATFELVTVREKLYEQPGDIRVLHLWIFGSSSQLFTKCMINAAVSVMKKKCRIKIPKKAGLTRHEERSWKEKCGTKSTWRPSSIKKLEGDETSTSGTSESSHHWTDDVETLSAPCEEGKMRWTRRRTFLLQPVCHT